VDLTLTEEQRAVRDLAREFTTKHILPFAAEWNETKKFPANVYKELGGVGLLGLPFPEQYGGGNTDTLSLALAVEEIAKGDGSVALTYAAHISLGSAPINNWGTEEQKRKYLTPLAKGEGLGSLALTEASGGSDLAGGVKTTARLVGDEWVINGSKLYVTNGAVARSIITLCRTDPGQGARGMSLIIVPQNAPGLRIGKLESKMGLHTSLTTQIFFDDCRVPKQNILGKPGDGFAQAMKTLNGGRIGIGALSLGLGTAALEASVKYAHEREAFGHPIADLQAIQHMIADCAMELEAARLLIYRAADAKDRGKDFTVEASMAKLFASEAADRACWKAIQIHGGAGYLADFPVERMYRDNRLMLIGEGTSEVQRYVIAREILHLNKN
jgi:alkylation response protein AidB-like acyl-CoA dehydrogenase